MKNAMQLKAYVKNLAKEKKISAQIVLQNYMLERLLERISVSEYRDNFILKGGFLLVAMAVPLKIDITTGDKITPREVIYTFNLMFEERTINVLAYTIETILAEKLETIISRGDQNTRPRDFYDVYILNTLQKKNIDNQILKEAFAATVKKRGTEHIVTNYKEIIETVLNSSAMKDQWTRYQKEFDYAKDIRFEDTCNAANGLMVNIIM